MNIETIGLGAGSYPDAPEPEEYVDDDLQEAYEYDAYEDYLIEKNMEEENGKEK